jgi:carboxyl-terminal processing protease
MLILDLRNNLGGYMDIFSKIAGMLVEKHSSNQVAYKSVTRDGTETLHYISDSVYDSYGFEKIIVLANEYTASASETLIGTMLDYDTQNKVSVIIEGQEKDGQAICKTYGKGIMQTTYGLIGGGAFKLTTARMLWPDGKTCIHNVGIKTSAENSVDAGENAINRAIEVLK